jgi:hypothetical protein
VTLVVLVLAAAPRLGRELTAALRALLAIAAKFAEVSALLAAEALELRDETFIVPPR